MGYRCYGYDCGYGCGGWRNNGTIGILILIILFFFLFLDNNSETSLF